jgi:small subunit ribosomal protein S20
LTPVANWDNFFDLFCHTSKYRATQKLGPGAFVPNIKSAKKDLRRSRAAAVRNRAQRSALRTAVKKARVATAAAADHLSAVSLLDRAARKGLIHRNAAARVKSRLAKQAAASAA